MAEAEREMEYVCGRMTMAERAFYQVTNRGTGPSVHLMRELARIWGNVDYGVKELHRDDSQGISEVQAFSWDIQKNTRSSRTFIVPHQRMVKIDGVQQRKDLVDLTDIYLNNQNVGARAVRECIDTILPRWFVEKAQDICHETLRNGEGKPLRDRIEALISAFDGLGVTVKQLEARVGKDRGQWTPEDVAQLTVAGQSIKRGEARAADLFPAVEASSAAADEIAAAPAPEEKKRTTRRPRAAKNKESADAESGETTQVTQQGTRDGDGDTNEVDNAGASDTPADPDPGAAQDAGPGQDVGNDQSQGAETSSGATPGSDSGDQEPAAEPQPPKTAMRKAVENRLFQMTSNIHKIVGGKALSREERVALYNYVFDRTDITSTDDLYDPEVAAVADKLFQWGKDDKLVDHINEVRNLVAIAEAADGGQQELAVE
ncbi:hypothetical protein [Mycolicibacterium mageritense]|nr:hypothetical protein [Mycolicibacterium mageritense]